MQMMQIADMQMGTKPYPLSAASASKSAIRI